MRKQILPRGRDESRIRRTRESSIAVTANPCSFMIMSNCTGLQWNGSSFERAPHPRTREHCCFQKTHNSVVEWPSGRLP